jgi:hypothetical protein
MKSAEKVRIIQNYKYVDQTEEEIIYPILTREEMHAYEAACMAFDLGVNHSGREKALEAFISFYEPHFKAAQNYNDLCKRVEKIAE